MRLSAQKDDARLELRVLELEGTVEAMARIIGTMTEMLSGLNRVAAHYADTVTALVPTPLLRAVQPVPGGARACAEDDPDGDGRC
jgi:hypothetical protein